MTHPTGHAALALSLVSAGFDVPRCQVVSHSRREPHVTARHTYWYIMNKLHGWSMRSLGEGTGCGFDHTAVVFGITRINRLLTTKDKRFHPTITKVYGLAESYKQQEAVVNKIRK